MEFEVGPVGLRGEKHSLKLPFVDLSFNLLVIFFAVQFRL
jgi:hypothetical protein